MNNQNLIFTKLEGYSGIRLKNNKPLTFKSGINLLVGRNGSGKTNLLQLINQICLGKGDLKGKVESSYFLKKFKPYLKDDNFDWNNPKFKNVKIIQYEFMGKQGDIRLHVTNVPHKYVLENLVSNGRNFSSNIHLSDNHVNPVRHKSISSNANNFTKFELTGYLLNSSLFSTEHNNQAHSIMKEPISVVSNFIRERLSEFFVSPEFVEKIHKLEVEINRLFTQYFRLDRQDSSH